MQINININQIVSKMKGIKKIVRKEVRGLIIANNGDLKNEHINPIIARYEPFFGLNIVTIVQAACSYFRFSSQQEAFRNKYNYQ